MTLLSKIHWWSTRALRLPMLFKYVSDLRNENKAQREQLVSIGKENADLRRLYGPLAQRIGQLETENALVAYNYKRFMWRNKALSRELFGPANLCAPPPREIPQNLMAAFTLNGRIPVEYAYMDCAYPDNWPLIYTDEEVEDYIGMIKTGKNFIYGTVDECVQRAFEKYPVTGLDVVTMGSITPWYESMIIAHGGRPNTIDYNRIVARSPRLKTWTVAEYERSRPVFDYALSISSFEHDGLGAYGDPLDPDGDLKAMQKMKTVVKPGGILLFAVPVGADKILFNNARIYGRVRLPMVLKGWSWIDSFGYEEALLDSNGSNQPVLVLRNNG